MSELVENNLPLPPLLVSLIEQGTWKHPGDAVMLRVIPFLLYPVDFLPPQRLKYTHMWIADNPRSSHFFHEVRGSKSAAPVQLPWLDIECAIIIAENRELGDDVAIALDYRTSDVDPRVVATAINYTERCFEWQEVVATFSGFVELLDINQNSKPE
jgi:hypothetical protein